MNYTELMTAVKDYLEVDETTFDTHFPQFVKNAEEEIYRNVQLPDLRKNSTSKLASGDPYLTTPSDYLSTYSLAIIVSGSHQFLISKDVNFIREAFPAEATTGVPRYFAQFEDENFIIGPTPDDAYDVELHYFYKPEPLSLTNATTWLSENAEGAILFGTIYHGYVFLKGDQDVVKQYRDQFDTSMAHLKLIAEGRNRKDSYRKIDSRIPV